MRDARCSHARDVSASGRYQFDPKFGMFACKEILPELIARFEALDEVQSFYFYFCLSFSSLLLRTGAGRWM